MFHCTGWVSDVRKGGHDIRIVPRILFEGWTMTDYQDLFASQTRQSQLAVFITEQLAVKIQ